MPDDPAFIRAIAAAPADDAPRLVYADVLDERGDEVSAARAEFIRVQIERARLEPRSPRWSELWHRDSELLDWARRWREELPAVSGVIYGGYVRGFIDRVEVSLDQGFPQGIDAIFDAVPVRRLELKDLDDRAAEQLSRWSGLERVRELALRGVVFIDRDNPPSYLAANRAERGLPELIATGECVVRLIERGPWPNLVHLDLKQLNLGEPRAAAAVALLRRLRGRFAAEVW